LAAVFFGVGGIVSLGEGEIPPPKKRCRERTVTVGWLLQNPRASPSQVSDVLLARHRSRLLQHSLRRRRTLQPAALPHQLFMYYVHSVAAFSFLPAPRNNTGPVITPAASSGKGVRHRSGVRPSVRLPVCPTRYDTQNNSSEGSTKAVSVTYRRFSPSADILFHIRCFVIGVVIICGTSFADT